VGDHQQDPLAAQVPDEEREQVAGGLVGPVQILDHQHQRGLLAQAPKEAEQQLEQPGLGRRAGRVFLWLAQPGGQAGELRPGEPDEPADGLRAQLGQQDSQGLHDRGIRQGAVADRHTAPGQHPGPIRGACDQLGDQAGLADTGLAPHQDDGRFAICGPPSGRLEGLELREAADEGGARHAAAHLAGIIARDRPEGNGGRTRPATRAAVRGRRPKMGSSQAPP
jgi:hypothetical protein